MKVLIKYLKGITILVFFASIFCGFVVLKPYPLYDSMVYFLNSKRVTISTKSTNSKVSIFISNSIQLNRFLDEFNLDQQKLFFEKNTTHPFIRHITVELSNIEQPMFRIYNSKNVLSYSGNIIVNGGNLRLQIYINPELITNPLLANASTINSLQSKNEASLHALNTMFLELLLSYKPINNTDTNNFRTFKSLDLISKVLGKTYFDKENALFTFFYEDN